MRRPDTGTAVEYLWIHLSAEEGIPEAFRRFHMHIRVHHMCYRSQDPPISTPLLNIELEQVPVIKTCSHTGTNVKS